MTSMPEIQSLHSKIAQLEDDNLSLTQAAEEAATLAEALASENADVRGQNNRLTSRINEKESEIVLISSRLDKEIEEKKQLKGDLEEITNEGEEQAKKITEYEEMEKTYRHTILKLEQANSNNNKGKENNNQHHLLLSNVKAYQSLMKIFNESFQHSNIIIVILHIKFLISLTTAFASNDIQCHNNKQLNDTLIKINILCKKISSYIFNYDHENENESQKFISAPIDVQLGLLDLSIESLESYVPNNINTLEISSEIEEELCLKIESILQRMSDSNNDRNQVSSIISANNSDIIVERLKNELDLKDRKIEDTFVRCKAFEDALNQSRNDLNELQLKFDELKTEVKPVEGIANSTSKLNQEDEENEENTDRSITEDNTRLQRNKEDEQSNEQKSNQLKALEKSTVATHELNYRQQTRMNWNKLRSCYLQGAISDLKPYDSKNCSGRENEIELQTLRNTMKTALHRARLAAANAHVVKLDDDSLEPKTSGVTMSHRAIQEAVAIGQRQLRQKAATSCKTTTTQLHVIVPQNDSIDNVIRSFQTQIM